MSQQGCTASGNKLQKENKGPWNLTEGKAKGGAGRKKKGT